MVEPSRRTLARGLGSRRTGLRLPLASGGPLNKVLHFEEGLVVKLLNINLNLPVGGGGLNHHKQTRQQFGFKVGNLLVKLLLLHQG